MTFGELAFYVWLLALLIDAGYMTFFCLRHALNVGAHAADDDRIIEGWGE